MRYGVSKKADRYRAASRSLPGNAESEAVNRASEAIPACSATSATSTPFFARVAATGSRSAPDPATTAVRPPSPAPVFAIAWAPPAPMTPGRVQPGKGRKSSRAPVARTTRRARTTQRPAAVSAESFQPPPPATASKTDAPHRTTAPETREPLEPGTRGRGDLRAREMPVDLPARRWGLVEHDGRRSALGRAARRRDARRAGADHRDIARELFRPSRKPGAGNRELARRRHPHPVPHDLHAGAAVRDAVDRDAALEADAHRAEDAARLARDGGPADARARVLERGGHRDARRRRRGEAVDREPDGLSHAPPRGTAASASTAPDRSRSRARGSRPR